MSEGLLLIPLAAILLCNLPLGCLRQAAYPFGILFALFQAATAVAYPWTGAGHCFFALQTDNLSRVMLLAIAIVTLAALMVGRSTIPEEKKRFQFTNLLLLAVVGMNGIVMVADVFTLYVFVEIVAVASFILIAFHKDKDGLEGAFKYVVLSAVATVMMLSAIAVLLMVAGNTTFAAIAAGLAAPAGRHALVLLAVAVFLCGLLIKSGIMPFHGWLPDAYSAAPAATSVLLAGIVTKTTGVYVLIRLIQSVFPASASINAVLMLAGAVSIVLGAFAAIGQSDFKRMLAYSSISQVGYIVLGFAAGTPLAMAGAVLHLFNHSVFKSLLFVNAAAVEQQTGTRNMDQLGGLSARMPVTSFSCLAGLLSTAGIPPFAGFWSKLIIVIALWQAGQVGYAVTAILASLLTLAYFLSMQRRVFFGQLRAGLEHTREAGLGILVPELLLTLITIAFGLLIPWLFGTFILPIKGL